MHLPSTIPIIREVILIDWKMSKLQFSSFPLRLWQCFNEFSGLFFTTLDLFKKLQLSVIGCSVSQEHVNGICFGILMFALINSHPKMLAQCQGVSVGMKRTIPGGLSRPISWIFKLFSYIYIWRIFVNQLVMNAIELFFVYSVCLARETAIRTNNKEINYIISISVRTYELRTNKSPTPSLVPIVCLIFLTAPPPSRYLII